jgi:hypothetical protein
MRFTALACPLVSQMNSEESERVQPTNGRYEIKRRARWPRWYPKKLDDMIIARWAEACSERHNDCCSCPFLEKCQDLMDRLIACMDVKPTGHRETYSDFV